MDLGSGGKLERKCQMKRCCDEFCKEIDKEFVVVKPKFFRGTSPIALSHIFSPLGLCCFNFFNSLRKAL